MPRDNPIADSITPTYRATVVVLPVNRSGDRAAPPPTLQLQISDTIERPFLLRVVVVPRVN